MDTNQSSLILRAWRLNSSGFNKFTSYQEAEAYLKAYRSGIVFTNTLNRVMFLFSLVLIILTPFFAEIITYIIIFIFFEYFGTLNKSDLLIISSTFFLWIMIMYFIGFILLRRSNKKQTIEFKLPAPIIQSKLFRSVKISFLVYGLLTLIIALLLYYLSDRDVALFILFLLDNSELPHGTIHGYALLSFMVSYSIAKYFEHSRRFYVVEWVHTGKWKE